VGIGMPGLLPPNKAIELTARRAAAHGRRPLGRFGRMGMKMRRWMIITAIVLFSVSCAAKKGFNRGEMESALRAGSPTFVSSGLTVEQIATLRKWADSGAAEGDRADKPPPPHFADGWQTRPTGRGNEHACFVPSPR